jgi:hypothetical protein
MFDPKPSLSMREVELPYIGRASIELEADEFIEIERLSLLFGFGGLLPGFLFDHPSWRR